MPQHRQPPGVPTGGQFATGGRLRPKLHLSAEGVLGLDATIAAPFTELGFDPDDALEWHEAGFDADEAITWRDLHGRHVTPATAAGFAHRHVSASQALDYTALGVLDPRSVSDFIEARISGPDAAAWQSSLRGIRVEDHYLGNAAADWDHNGFTVAEMQPWAKAGQLHPASAREWRTHDFTPEDAAVWDRALFGAEEAASWRSEGFTPQQADYWATRGFDAVSARRESTPLAG